ncbi:DUF7127 family protein [Halobacterium litoreum]|uniref:Hsp20/alpha crystallin family protein n=1 Tax=Halobacterium litoreum TaxID=2039234 RepID=A0ABD5NCQ1_9EURY|nr:hypothetical protein [Halobacterium litoreum]UHH14161.1 hypothetical protein LT972_03965 [Halobacterium litoreum]
MSLNAFTDETDALARRYDYDDGSVLVADLGVGDDDASVDVVDGTVILVLERDGTTSQHELDAPEGTVAKALINNGVVTVEVER